MAKERDYAKEYREYHAKPSQRKNRSNRNKARRLMIKKHGKAKLDGKDVDHKRPMKNGGGNHMNNLRIRSVKANRGDKSF
jgi:hypothetical protein